MNLATHPSKNRRFFFFLTAILVFLICLFSILSGSTFLGYHQKNRNFALTKAQIERKMQDVQRENRRLTMLIEDASQKHGERLDFINSLIYKKSFSWVEFLSSLEESLPETCYVVSMVPSLKENSKMEVRLKIAAPNLDELLKLNKNLYEQHFTNIRIINESTNEAGMLVSEISLVYERTV
jgi:Tfp pilus assembly protein PilN